MSNQSLTSTLPIKIDPNFNVPPGIINVVYDDTTRVIDTAVPGGSIEYEGDTDVETGPAPTGLYAPNYLNVISQKVYRTPEGQHFVDIVVEVEDVPGAEEYEIRVVKL